MTILVRYAEIVTGKDELHIRFRTTFRSLQVNDPLLFMKPFLLLPAFCLFMAGMVSCSTVKPDGALKEVAEGDLFSGPEPAAVPPDYTMPEPARKPPLRWKIALDDH